MPPDCCAPCLAYGRYGGLNENDSQRHNLITGPQLVKLFGQDKEVLLVLALSTQRSSIESCKSCLVGGGVPMGVGFELSKDWHHPQCLSLPLTFRSKCELPQPRLWSVIMDSNPLKL